MGIERPIQDSRTDSRPASREPQAFSITAQTPDNGDGVGKFRKDLQVFLEDPFFDDCALLADGVTTSFDGTSVEGACLFDLKKPVELCNPVDKTAVVPPRQRPDDRP